MTNKILIHQPFKIEEKDEIIEITGNEIKINNEKVLIPNNNTTNKKESQTLKKLALDT